MRLKIYFKSIEAKSYVTNQEIGQYESSFELENMQLKFKKHQYK